MQENPINNDNALKKTYKKCSQFIRWLHCGECKYYNYDDRDDYNFTPTSEDIITSLQEQLAMLKAINIEQGERIDKVTQDMQRLIIEIRKVNDTDDIVYDTEDI